VVRQTFKGFTALPAPPGRKDWREVLKLHGSGMTPDAVDRAYRELATKAHPDRGGSTEAMAELNRARAEAKAALE
jgi:curved DNA-binding protein CbpA